MTIFKANILLPAFVEKEASLTQLESGLRLQVLRISDDWHENIEKVIKK